jgi:hypothetical protein
MAKMAGVPVRMHTLQDSYFPTKKDFTAAFNRYGPLAM